MLSKPSLGLSFEPQQLRKMHQDRYLQLIAGFAGKRVLILGDVMLDRFIYGKVERILLPRRRCRCYGIARGDARRRGQCGAQLASLGGQAVLLGVIGEDEAGRILCSSLLDKERGLERHTLTLPDRPTTVKTRFIAERQQVVRVSQWQDSHRARANIQALLNSCERQLANADVLVLSDYAKGVLSDEVVRGVVRSASAAGKPVIVDPKSASVAQV